MFKKVYLSLLLMVSQVAFINGKLSGTSILINCASSKIILD